MNETLILAGLWQGGRGHQAAAGLEERVLASLQQLAGSEGVLTERTFGGSGSGVGSRFFSFFSSFFFFFSGFCSFSFFSFLAFFAGGSCRR